MRKKFEAIERLAESGGRISKATPPCAGLLSAHGASRRCPDGAAPEMARSEVPRPSSSGSSRGGLTSTEETGPCNFSSQNAKINWMQWRVAGNQNKLFH